jgi:hypothetical protein
MSEPTRAFCLLVLASLGITGCASTRKAYNSGYDRGRSDAVKQQYWIIQNQQKNTSPTPEPKVKRVPVTTTCQHPDGTLTVPTTEFIRIEE